MVWTVVAQVIVFGIFSLWGISKSRIATHSTVSCIINKAAVLTVGVRVPASCTRAVRVPGTYIRTLMVTSQFTMEWRNRKSPYIIPSPTFQSTGIFAADEIDRSNARRPQKYFAPRRIRRFLELHVETVSDRIHRSLVLKNRLWNTSCSFGVGS
jgi:hypothetical protein